MKTDHTARSELQFSTASSRKLLFVPATAALMSVLALPLSAQGSQSASSRTVNFAYLRGADTLATESVSFGTDTVKGVLRFPNQPIAEWIQVRKGNKAGQLRILVRAPGANLNTAPLQEFTFDIAGDSAVVVTRMGSNTQTDRVASKSGAVSLVGQSVLQSAIIGKMLSSDGRLSAPLFVTNGGLTIDGTVSTSEDTTTLTVGGVGIRSVWRNGQLLEASVPLQGLRVVRSQAAGAPPSSPAPAPEPIDYSAPSDAPYTAQQVTIPTARGYSLSATLTLPKNPSSRLPVAITISGSGPQERDSRISIVPGYQPFREIADTLGRRGIAVLRYDDRGVGKSGGADSRANATSADFADDVQSVIAWLKTRPDIDPNRIALIGHSEGGLIAPITAVRDSSVRALVLLAGPAWDGRKVLMFQNEMAIQAAAGLTNAQRDSLRRTIPAALDSLERNNRWMAFFMQTNPLSILAKVRQPVLVLQGDTDQQVTPEQADSVAATLRAAGNRKVTLKHFPNTNHLFLADASGSPQGYTGLTNVHVRPEVLGSIANWLVDTLG